jgi:hypothetical protein
MIPDKIYIGTVTLSSNSPSEEHLLPDWHLRPNPKVANVEYIRKDTLLEWAKEHQEGERQGSYTWSCYQIFIDKLNEM